MADQNSVYSKLKVSLKLQIDMALCPHKSVYMVITVFKSQLNTFFSGTTLITLEFHVLVTIFLNISSQKN